MYYYLITKDYSQAANVVHAFSTTTFLAYSCYMSNTNCCYYYYYYYYYYYLTIPVIPR
jgi:hypothetical protein